MPRSKFDDPTSSFYPPGIPAWQRAQVNVNTMSGFLFEQLPTDGSYVVPEPTLFVARESVEKSCAMLAAWFKYLILCLSFSSLLAKPKHGKAWAVLLGAEYTAQKAGNTPEIRAKEIRRLQEEMLLFLGNTVGDDGVEVLGQLDLSTKSVSWQDIPFSDLQTVHFKQIL